MVDDLYKIIKAIRTKFHFGVLTVAGEMARGGAVRHRIRYTVRSHKSLNNTYSNDWATSSDVR